MPNSTKTWQEEFKLKRYNVYATVFQLSKYNNQQLKEKADVMVQFISDLRKRDMEALIEIMKDEFAPSDNFLTIDLIKNYYEN